MIIILWVSINILCPPEISADVYVGVCVRNGENPILPKLLDKSIKLYKVTIPLLALGEKLKRLNNNKQHGESCVGLIFELV